MASSARVMVSTRKASSARVMFSARAGRVALAVRLRARIPVAAVGVLVALPLVAVGGVDARPVAAPAAAPDAVVALATTTEPAAAVAPPAPRPDRAQPLLEPDARVEPTAPTTLQHSRPTHVRIAAIGIDSELVGLGLKDDGSMEVPPGAFPAGWYTGAPTPGELGPAILAGHVDYGGAAGVFHRLHELGPGDTVEVTREDGTTAVFQVTSVQQHRKDAFPTAAVYGDIDHAGLRLITCGGTFDRGVRSYEDNIVVFAELDMSSQPRPLQ